MTKQVNELLHRQRKMVLLTEKPGLGRRLQGQLTQCVVESTTSVDELLHCCQKQVGCFGVVDLAKLKAQNDLQTSLAKIHQFSLSGHAACLIAMLDGEGHQSTGRLFQVGFQGVTRPQETKIAALAKRYWGSVAWPLENVTESVISNLPWSAIE